MADTGPMKEAGGEGPRALTPMDQREVIADHTDDSDVPPNAEEAGGESPRALTPMDQREVIADHAGDGDVPPNADLKSELQ